MVVKAQSDFENAVIAVVSSLHEGEVVTYGEVASEAGFPGAARAVGRILATSEDLPWWRVVNASGRLVPGNELEHQRLLECEGVSIVGQRVAR